jgi:hypothetical protein
MYGASIETDFQHIEFESEQMKRRLEMQRLFETGEQRPQQRPRRSLVHIFGRLAPRLDLRASVGRSPVVPG